MSAPPRASSSSSTTSRLRCAIHEECWSERCALVVVDADATSALPPRGVQDVAEAALTRSIAREATANVAAFAREANVAPVNLVAALHSSRFDGQMGNADSVLRRSTLERQLCESFDDAARKEKAAEAAARDLLASQGGCVICRQDDGDVGAEDGHAVALWPGCRHAFHDVCLAAWCEQAANISGARRCPICRRHRGAPPSWTAMTTADATDALSRLPEGWWVRVTTCASATAMQGPKTVATMSFGQHCQPPPEQQQSQQLQHDNETAAAAAARRAWCAAVEPLLAARQASRLGVSIDELAADVDGLDLSASAFADAFATVHGGVRVEVDTRTIAGGDCDRCRTVVQTTLHGASSTSSSRVPTSSGVPMPSVVSSSHAEHDLRDGLQIIAGCGWCGKLVAPERALAFADGNAGCLACGYDSETPYPRIWCFPGPGSGWPYPEPELDGLTEAEARAVMDEWGEMYPGARCDD